MSDSEYSATQELETTLAKEDSLLTDLMADDEYATWFATSAIFGVMGTQFSSRASVPPLNRKIIDAITLSIACYIVIWATLSIQKQLTSVQYQRMRISVVVLTILLYLTFIIGTATEQFG